MSQIGNISARTTLLMSSNQLLSSMQRTQRDLLDRQNEISTGLRVQKPSDDPGSVATILALEQRVETNEQLDRNLQHALSVLNNADQALDDAYDLIIEARAVASSQIGIGSDTETRFSQSTVVDTQLQALVEMANRQFQGTSLFAGRRSTGGPDGQAFVSFLGGIRYVGDGKGIAGDLGLDEPLEFNTNGLEAFGSLSTRVRGQVDLNPQTTASTRLQDLSGAQGRGVRRGSIEVTIDGTGVIVDLSDADTLGDVVTRINNAIDPAAGSVSISSSGLVLTANAGHAIRIDDVSEGQTAADLGVTMSATSAAVIGVDLDPRLTELTELASLGLGGPMDMTSGLQISQGAYTGTIDFSAASTIQDLINAVEQPDLGLRLEINDKGTGLDLVTDVSGLDFSIGENGGTTAGDLGLRTFSEDTRLSDFSFGIGVAAAEEKDDFAFELHDGSTINVNIDGVTTVGQLIDRIANTAASAGLVVGQPGDAGTDFNVGFVPTGNGMQFEDNTTGANDFRVINLGTSLAATDLGMNINAGSSNSIVSEDLAKVRVEGVFTHLINLRDSLATDDGRGIRFAGDGMEADLDHMSRARAGVAVRAQRVERQQERLADVDIAERTLLSELRDVDLTEAITRFTQLQQQLEASLRVGSLNLQLNLLDFLR